LVAVDADDHALSSLDLFLELEAGVGDLALRVVLLDRVDHAAELVDAAEVVVGAVSDTPAVCVWKRINSERSSLAP
jgi:hypothetical protein